MASEHDRGILPTWTVRRVFNSGDYSLVKAERSLAFVAAVLLIEPFVQHALAFISRDREPLPCTCIGRRDAAVNIVYLHGLDTVAPSWQEIQNREKLRAIAQILDARIALPRGPGRWPQRSDIAKSVDLIEQASRACFRSSRLMVVGFSDGANVVNQLYVSCRPDIASTYVSAGSSEVAFRRDAQSLARCGQLVLIAGRHEPGFETTRIFATQLAKRGYRVQFVAHSGPHELPFSETLMALRQGISHAHE